MPLTKTTHGYCIEKKKITFKDGKESFKFRFVGLQGETLPDGYLPQDQDVPVCEMELDAEGFITESSLKKNAKNQVSMVWAQKAAYGDEPPKWVLNLIATK